MARSTRSASSSRGWLERTSTRMARKDGPSYSPLATTDRSGSSTPRLRATWATERVKQDATAESSTSVGCIPVSSPPCPDGSSTRSSNWRTETTHRYAPSQRAVTSTAVNANPGRAADPAPPREQVRVVNVGLPLFAEAVRAQGAAAVQVDWRIPAGGRPDLVAALTRLYGPLAERVDAANREVLRRLDQGAPALVGVASAVEVVPGMGGRTVLHCGPPLAWEEFCDPLRRSARATVVAEGWADGAEAAGRLIAAGGVELEPANHHAAVVPMATTLGPSAPVFVVDNPQGGNRAFAPVNQGPGATAWFGVDAPAAVERLVWLREAAAPVLAETLARAGRVELLPIAAQGLQMGDDLHMRTQAATNLLLRQLLPDLVAVDSPALGGVARFLAGNHLFFLNLAMAAAKALTDHAAAVPDASVVVAMARNGTTFGIRLAGEEDWHLAPAPPVGRALYYPGFGPDSSAPDIGDSAVLELIGLGGPAAAASPAVAAFLGGTVADAVATTEAMDRICLGRSARFKLPLLDYRGTPVGVDVRRAVELALTPSINTGILHAADGTGQVGAGIAEAPLDCFQQALLALDARLAR